MDLSDSLVSEVWLSFSGGLEGRLFFSGVELCVSFSLAFGELPFSLEFLSLALNVSDALGFEVWLSFSDGCKDELPFSLGLELSLDRSESLGFEDLLPAGFVDGLLLSVSRELRESASFDFEFPISFSGGFKEELLFSRGLELPSLSFK